MLTARPLKLVVLPACNGSILPLCGLSIRVDRIQEIPISADPTHTMSNLPKPCPGHPRLSPSQANNPGDKPRGQNQLKISADQSQAATGCHWLSQLVPEAPRPHLLCKYILPNYRKCINTRPCPSPVPCELGCWGVWCQILPHRCVLLS